MENQKIAKFEMDSALANRLTALVKENHLPFELIVGNLSDEDVHVQIIYEEKNEEFLNKIISETINELYV